MPRRRITLADPSSLLELYFSPDFWLPHPTWYYCPPRWGTFRTVLAAPTIRASHDHVNCTSSGIHPGCAGGSPPPRPSLAWPSIFETTLCIWKDETKATLPFPAVPESPSYLFIARWSSVHHCAPLRALSAHLNDGLCDAPESPIANMPQRGKSRWIPCLVASGTSAGGEWR